MLRPRIESELTILPPLTSKLSPRLTILLLPPHSPLQGSGDYFEGYDPSRPLEPLPDCSPEAMAAGGVVDPRCMLGPLPQQPQQPYQPPEQPYQPYEPPPTGQQQPDGDAEWQSGVAPEGGSGEGYPDPQGKPDEHIPGGVGVGYPDGIDEVQTGEL